MDVREKWVPFGHSIDRTRLVLEGREARPSSGANGALWPDARLKEHIQRDG